MTNVLENARPAEAPTEIIVNISSVWEALTLDDQYWVDYRACQGLRFTEDGKVVRMTVGECAEVLGVAESTLRRREARIERFEELKAWRRTQLFGDKVVGAAWGATAIKAAKGEDAAVERILTNFDPNYKSPRQTVEHDVGDNIIEMFALMRKEAQIIDGDYTEADAGASPVDGAERPASLPEQS